MITLVSRDMKKPCTCFVGFENLNASLLHLLLFVSTARPEYQTEVGLLTRTIKVQGSATDSQPTDTSPSSCQLYDHNGSARSVFGYDQVTCPNTYLTGYGGHIVMYGSGMGFVEGVELFRMGQTNFMGRYRKSGSSLFVYLGVHRLFY